MRSQSCFSQRSARKIFSSDTLWLHSNAHAHFENCQPQNLPQGRLRIRSDCHAAAPGSSQYYAEALVKDF
ncbi:hypothetical protein AN958_06105 [Leucoagaricus sp. SymC.cos]|nr:hypothetical protein AN958_06105 [Leucoagaricus sp. SymC.cos]